jgi:hypothetical protein
MLAEEVLPQFHFTFIEMDVATVAAQQAITTFASNTVAEIIAQNCETLRRAFPALKRYWPYYPLSCTGRRG